MAVYTKTGDKGKTSTFSGKRVSKSSQLIKTIGAIDELNSYLGIVGGLTEVQKNLFTINAILSGAKLEPNRSGNGWAQKVREMEKEIDEIEGKLPVQKNFLIYGGTKKAAQIYFARSLARTAERELSALPKVDPKIRMYINRLSDYLFMCARFVNFGSGIKEEPWSG